MITYKLITDKLITDKLITEVRYKGGMKGDKWGDQGIKSIGSR